MRFLAAVDDAIARAVANPGVGALTATGYRGVKTKRFKYVVYYRSPTAGVVEVFAVAHASRRPGYWFGRTRRL
jgi:plasmid stabilization system protein ParE